jgi:hypothetical protein
MPYTVLITSKKFVLSGDISKIQRLLNDAYIESGLLKEQETKPDTEEFLGDDKQARGGLLNNIVRLYETINDTDAGGHEKKLPQCKYYLDAPARKLQEAYVDYLNCVFYSYVKPEDAEKKDKKTQYTVINNSHVYVREILLRLFTAAISVNKNNSTSRKEAKKIIECLELFLKKINQTNVMYDRSFFSFSSDISNINIAFASEHKEWVYLLKQMQEIIETMHKHTATISQLMEVLNKAKTTAALQLIAYISITDVNQERLRPAWVKYTLLNCETEYLKQVDKKYVEEKHAEQNIAISSRLKLAAENYNSLQVTEHQRQLISVSANKNHPYTAKIKVLYELLTKTNLLLAILDQVDVLLSTTGWVLILTNVLNLNNLSKLIEIYSKEIIEALKFDIDQIILTDKKEIKKSLIANEALSGIDFAQNLHVVGMCIKDLQSGVIRNCIIDIISMAVDNLWSLQQHLNYQIIDQNELTSLTAKMEGHIVSIPGYHIVENKEISKDSLLRSSVSVATSLPKNQLDDNNNQTINNSGLANKEQATYKDFSFWRVPASQTTQQGLVENPFQFQYSDQQIESILSLLNQRYQ